MNNEFFKDVAKGIKKVNIDSELSPGTGRRYDPAGGLQRHNERIHRDSNEAKKSGKLPFSVRKPPKALGRPQIFLCANCSTPVAGTTATVGIICSNCGKFSKVIEVHSL